MKEEIKNILIDFGGVLIDLDKKRCIEQFEKLGIDVSTSLNTFYQGGIFMLHERGNITTAQFHEAIKEQAPGIVTDQQIDAAWNTFLVGIPSYKLDFLLELRKHYNVILLSNTNEIHWQWSLNHVFNYKGHQVEDFFNQIYLSYELKLRKPEKEIFQTILSSSHLNAKETFFLDDSPENCQVAEAMGIRTYTPAAKEDWRFIFHKLHLL